MIEKASCLLKQEAFLCGNWMMWALVEREPFIF
jgi:hypothetical protein